MEGKKERLNALIAENKNLKHQINSRTTPDFSGIHTIILNNAEISTLRNEITEYYFAEFCVYKIYEKCEKDSEFKEKFMNSLIISHYVVDMETFKEIYDYTLNLLPIIIDISKEELMRTNSPRKFNNVMVSEYFNINTYVSYGGKGYIEIKIAV